MMTPTRLALPFTLAALALLVAAPADAVRVKDVGAFEGVRANQLIGYGLVVGLDGTGDTDRASFTAQSVEAMLSRMGIRVDSTQLTLRNVAAVMVTASLPAFSKPGASIDVTVSSIGDARSLAGGTLLMTPLNGADGQTYAVSQGPLKVGSDADRDPRQRSLARRRLNVGRVPSGGLVEREVPITLGADGVLRFQLSRPDFQTALSVVEAVNGQSVELASRDGGAAATPPAGGAPAAVTTAPAPPAIGAEPMARVIDSGGVEITVPEAFEEDVAAFIARVEVLEVRADSVARVIVNGRTGAVVLGGNVRLSRAAVAYDALTVEVEGPPPAPPEGAADAPPPPAGGAPAAVTTAPTVSFNSRQVIPSGLQIVDEAATLADLVAGLNALGLSARELIDILEALSAAGALHARLEVI